MKVKRVLEAIFVLVISSVKCIPLNPCPVNSHYEFDGKCVPVSPCPMNFHYEFDGNQWFGVVRIYPNHYNRLRTDRVTLKLTLFTNRNIPNHQNYRLLQLYKTLPETYNNIAARNPILYRINFPFRRNIPELLKIEVNGVNVCRTNRPILHTVSLINLQYTIYVPTTTPDDEPIDDYDNSFEYDTNWPDQSMENHGPQVIEQRGEEEEDLQLPNSCGQYDNKFKYTQLISGGEKISAGTWPWLVAIFRKDTRAGNLVFQCTGSLISNRLVVTAAHCFKADPNIETISEERIVLAFGRHDLRDWTEKHMVISDVEEIILHPDYLSRQDSTIFDADIAILVTKDNIKYTSMIKPICLWPTSTDNSYSIIGTNGTLVGWGNPQENVHENTPRRLSLPVVRNRHCFPKDKSSNAKRVFCAGNKHLHNAPCNGDSGSAFAIHVNGAWLLRGVVSAALGDPILNRCDLNTYAIFIDIIHYRTWIQSYM